MKPLGLAAMSVTAAVLMLIRCPRLSGAAELAAEPSASSDVSKGPASAPADKRDAVAALLRLGARLEVDESDGVQSVAAVKM